MGLSREQRTPMTDPFMPTSQEIDGGDGHTAGCDVRVEPHSGSREELRPLFELAEDSPAQLDSYLASGRVLVALLGTEVIGHLQLVETDRPGEVEIKNVAVREDHQGRGVGGRLVRAATELVTAESGSALLVATAASDNLHSAYELPRRGPRRPRRPPPSTAWWPGTRVRRWHSPHAVVRTHMRITPDATLADALLTGSGRSTHAGGFGSGYQAQVTTGPGPQPRERSTPRR